MKFLFIPVFMCCISIASAQEPADTIFTGKKVITLSAVVIDKNLNVPGFIRKIKEDSSYYKAFKNLRIIGFTAINDIRMQDKHGDLKASLRSKTKQSRINNCRSMQVLEEQATGDFYTEDGDYNYYTAQMYASLFFTKGTVCNENNIVGNARFSVQRKSGM